MHSQIDEVMNRNRETTRKFCWDKPMRDQVRQLLDGVDPSAIVCADGRAGDMSRATGMPLGIFQKYRAVGAKVNLGIPAVKYRMIGWAQYLKDNSRQGLFFLTSHHSRGGYGNCAGHNDSREASLENAFRNQQQFARIFMPMVIETVVVDLDTDTDSLVFHGETIESECLDILSLKEDDRSGLGERLRSIRPDLSSKSLNALEIMASNNLSTSLHFRANPKSHGEVVHNENGFAYGYDVDWVENDLFMRLSPFGFNQGVPLREAARLVHKNREEGRTPPGQNALLLTTGVYWEESGWDHLLAFEEATALAEFAACEIFDEVPELEGVTDILPLVVNHHDRSATYADKPTLVGG